MANACTSCLPLGVSSAEPSGKLTSMSMRPDAGLTIGARRAVVAEAMRRGEGASGAAAFVTGALAPGRTKLNDFSCPTAIWRSEDAVDESQLPAMAQMI